MLIRVNKERKKGKTNDKKKEEIKDDKKGSVQAYAYVIFYKIFLYGFDNALMQKKIIDN